MLRRGSAPVAGRYVLLEEIGRGSTGTVHRARDLRTRDQVAVKVLRDTDPASLLRFVREQAHRVEHPHVLAPLGWAADDQVALIVMELVTGGSLRDALARRGPLPPPEVALLLAQLLEALAAVHSRGVVHGDVKPGNLLLRPRPGGRPHLLLADFGIATCHHDAVRLVSAHPAGPVGTPGFWAPELRAGAAPHSSQDVYAAGVVARRALAAPGPLLTLCDQLTRPDPQRRPTAAEALARLRELPITGRQRGRPGRPG